MKFAFWRNDSAPSAPTAGALPPPLKHSRMRRLVRSMFKAASSSPLDKWTATPVPPDQYITQKQPVLVARSREQWSDNDHIRAFIRIVRQNIVGPHGVLLQAKAKTAGGKLDKRANAAIEAAWEEWGKKQNCDIAARLSWRGMQLLGAETAARDGEFIIRMVMGPDAGPWGFALQVIDPQRLPVHYSVDRYTASSLIRNGIEYNRFGKALAYHFASTDEEDSTYYTMGGRGFVRVPADQVVHGFVTEMAGQRRGLPWASTSLFRLHHLEGFENAAVQNARAGASKMGFIQYRDGFGPECDDDTNVAETINAEPLSFHELPEGAEFKEFNPNYPNGEFATFHKAMLRSAAAGMGVLYNNLASDLEGVNFSSIRQGTLDEREHWKECQQWLIEDLIAPIFTAWLRYSLLAEKIVMDNGRPLPAARLPVYSMVQWQPRRWAWIDPRADQDANTESIRGGQNSFSNVIREQGRDPETVFQEIAQDLEAMKAAGIPDNIIELFMTGQPPKPPAAPPKEAPQ